MFSSQYNNTYKESKQISITFDTFILILRAYLKEAIKNKGNIYNLYIYISLLIMCYYNIEN